jgi:hypothetical protein
LALASASSALSSAMAEMEAQRVGLLPLGGQPAVTVVEVQRLPDILQAEPEALAAQDQHQPRPVAPGKEPPGPDPDRGQQLLGLVEPQGARGHVIGLAHLADGHHVAWN